MVAIDKSPLVQAQTIHKRGENNYRYIKIRI